MLFVDMENLTEKQKKEKDYDKLPQEMTPEIMAKATKLYLEELNTKFKDVLLLYISY